MPRIVDHAARRREIAAALWRVVRDEGVGAASVRSVAAEGGWSPGSLRHYFSTQSELYAFGVAVMGEQVVERVQGVLDDPDLGPLERAALVVEQLLPLDEQRTAEVLVWLAFADRARHDPVLRDVRRSAWLGTLALARRAVLDATGAPHPRTLEEPLEDVDLERRARRLQVLVDGWTLQAASYPDLVPPAAVSADLRAELADVARAHPHRR